MNATATFTPTVSGTYTFSLTVDDDDGGTGTDFVVVTVQNLPPVADAGPDRSGEPGTYVTLDGLGSSDSDADAITYAWTQEGGPPVTLIGANTSTPGFTPSEAGTYVFRLTVTDAEGVSTIDTVLVYVRAPFPMALTFLASLIVVGVLLALIYKNRRRKEAKTAGPRPPPSTGQLPD